MICHHPYPAPYYMWDAVNMQTQKVSKAPPFDGSVLVNFPAVLFEYVLSFGTLELWGYQTAFILASHSNSNLKISLGTRIYRFNLRLPIR